MKIKNKRIVYLLLYALQFHVLYKCCSTCRKLYVYCTCSIWCCIINKLEALEDVLHTKDHFNKRKLPLVQQRKKKKLVSLKKFIPATGIFTISRQFCHNILFYVIFLHKF